METEQTTKNNKKNTPKKKRPISRKIIHGVVYTFVGIFVILLLLFGFSQTAYFKNWLRDEVEEQVSTLLNGELEIGKIEGTIFTSLKLKNTVLTQGDKPLLEAEKIEVKMSPLKLIFKVIYLRKFELQNAKINLVEDENGKLNLIKLLPETEEDTTTTTFPFDIQVASLAFDNVDFSIKRYDYLNVDDTYKQLNLNNFILNNINLNLSAFADINDNEYRLNIDKLDFNSNIESFNLKNLSGNFLLTSEAAAIGDLQIKTSRSDFILHAAVNNINIFEEIDLEKFNSSDIKLELDAPSLSFEDLAVFIPGMEIINGNVEAVIKAEGTFAELDIDELNVKYRNTTINGYAQLLNVLGGEDLYITADLSGTKIDPDDPERLLSGVEIPTFPDYEYFAFDTLRYAGKPLSFMTNFHLRTAKGNIGAAADLNFSTSLLNYDVDLYTRNFDMQPLTGTSSNLNLSLTAEGSGTDPENLNTDINLIANNSVVSGYNISELKLEGDAENKLVNFDLELLAENSSLDFNGNVNFTDMDDPTYEFAGEVDNLNIGQLTPDTSLSSNLNFRIEGEGESFDPDNMNLFFSLVSTESSINQIEIDSTRLILDLRRDEGEGRVINLISDLADLSILGNYSVTDAITILSSEIDFITTSINNKLDIVSVDNPNDPQKDMASFFGESANNLSDSLSLEYIVDFKDFSLLSAFIPQSDLEVDGSITGKFKKQEDSLTFTMNSTLGYIRYLIGSDVYFVADAEIDFQISNGLESRAFDDISSELTMKVDRIYYGENIYNLKFSLAVEDDSIRWSLYALNEDYIKANLDGTFDVSSEEAILEIDTFNVRYYDLLMKNKEELVLSYDDEVLNFKKFNLTEGSGTISVTGSFSSNPGHKLNVKFENVSGANVAHKLLNVAPENAVESEISMDAEITGTFSSPKADVNLDINNITFNNKTFGSFNTDLTYEDNQLNVDLRFVDSLSTSDPRLSLKGNIPVGSEENMRLELNSDGFNLAALGSNLPMVSLLSGTMESDIIITGSTSDPVINGNLNINDASFVLQFNNLTYNTELSLNFQNKTISVDTLRLKNKVGTKFGGSLTGDGFLTLDQLSPSDAKLNIRGDLKVLGQESKGASPQVYGNLVIQTRDDITYKYSPDGGFLEIPIDVTVADLQFPLKQGAYKNTAKNFVYRYKQYYSEEEQEQRLIDSLIAASERNEKKGLGPSKEPGLNFNLNVKLDTEAKMVVALAEEFNQNLTVYLGGNFKYSVQNGVEDASGELTLLEGSHLEFLKKLDAEGSVRFEDELADPYLDLTATYTDYYYPTDSTGTADETLVAVKIKVDSYLSDLGENFIRDEDNIGVYVGAEAIENNNKDQSKTPSDAILFILAGKFTDNATLAEQNAAANTVANLAGSIVGGFLNRYLGNYVRSVQLRQVGNVTRFSLIGNAGKFRYEIGGSTDVFQDLSQANVKIEYPGFLFDRLVLRLERYEERSEINSTREIINEIGLKYRFQF